MIFQRSFFALAALFATIATFEGGVAAAEQQRRRGKSGKNGPPPPPPGQYYKKSPKSSKKNRPTPSPVTPPTPTGAVMTEKGLQSVLSVIKQIENDDKEAEADAVVPQEGGGTTTLLGGGAPNKFAISSSISLLSGYSIVAQSSGTFAFNPIKRCVNDDDLTACIEEVISDAGATHKQKTISDKSSRSSFMKAAISAEGGSVGTKVSASVEVMTQSEMSLESVSYTVLGTTITKEQRIRNPQKLILTDAAETTLKKDPKLFVGNYGLNFVHSISSGGSYMGSFNMVASKSSAQQELKAEVSAKYEGGVYSAEGSAKFAGKTSEKMANTEISGEWKSKPDPYLGNENGRPNIDLPVDLMNVYGNWSLTAKEKPAPVFLQTMVYFVSEEVQKILLNFDENDEAVKAIKGSVLVLSPATMETATTERVDTILLVKALETYKGWEEVKKYKDSSSFKPFYKKLEDLLVDANEYNLALTTGNIFTDASLVRLNRQLEKTLPFDQDIKNNGNQFGSWRYFSQRDKKIPGLQQRFEDDVKPGIKQLTVLKCRPQGNDAEKYIKGKNRLVNGFGYPMGDCGEHFVCRDEFDENGKAVLQVAEDKMKICLPVYWCRNTDKVKGDKKNCFNHDSLKTTDYQCCPDDAYCDPAVEPFDLYEPSMCKK